MKLSIGAEVYVFGKTPYGFSNGAEAKIVEQDEDGDWIAEYPNGSRDLVHPRQCRPQSPIKKQIRQRFERWCIQRREGYLLPLGASKQQAQQYCKPGDRIVRMIEVGESETVIPIRSLPLPNEVYVNQQSFDEAWRNYGFHNAQGLKAKEFIWDFLRERYRD